MLVKLEFYNPTGSYKDRMALAMIEGAEARGVLTPGMRVVEFTGGSTGSSLGMVCAAKGYRCVLLSSDAFAAGEAADDARVRRGAEDRSERRRQGHAGALRTIPRRRSPCSRPSPTRSGPISSTTRTRFDGYAGIGRELLEQAGGRIDVFCGAVGTGGMLSGVARALREDGGRARIVALEPASSPAMTAGRGGAHRVEGIATGRIPPHMSDAPTTRPARSTRRTRVRWRCGSRVRKACSSARRARLNIAAAVETRA